MAERHEHEPVMAEEPEVSEAPTGTKRYLVKTSKALVQNGVPIRAGQEIELTDEQATDPNIIVHLYTDAEADAFRAERDRLKQERAAARSDEDVQQEAAVTNAGQSMRRVATGQVRRAPTVTVRPTPEEHQ